MLIEKIHGQKHILVTQPKLVKARQQFKDEEFLHLHNERTK